MRIRIAKYSDTTRHEYMVNGSQILGEMWTITGTGQQGVIFYLYDELGAPIGLKYRFDTQGEATYQYYYFEKNLQGDVVAIYTSSGKKLGSYLYDAWGGFTIQRGDNLTTTEYQILSVLNPFRYRGYIYDSETGLYYLQSRYYNPGTGRFINADGYVSTGTGLLGNNMFAYCNNNPVMYVDVTGESFTAFVVMTILVSLIAAPVVMIVDDAFSDLDDISYADEVSEREKDANVDQKGLWYEIEGGGADASGVGQLEINGGAMNETYTWENVEINAGFGKVSGATFLSPLDGIGFSAMASAAYADAYFKIPIGTHEFRIGVGVYLGGWGATAMLGSETQIGLSNGIGGKVIIAWD